jgi:RNA polymerase sigma-70 factor (ECF subfamily)
MGQPSDRDLARRARRGDADAYGDLVRRYQASVFNVCCRLLGERREAEDLAQEAFLRAHARLESFDLDRPFGPWIRRVAANVCLNHLQLARALDVPLDDERDAAPRAAEPESARERAELSEAVRAALAGLPAPYRAVIELRHFQDMRYADIAAALQLPLSDVKSHLFRARKLLAEALKDVHRPR